MRPTEPRRSSGTSKSTGPSCPCARAPRSTTSFCAKDWCPKRRKRGRRSDTFATESNDAWSADFKGECPTRDGQLCYPLTVQDMYSRYVLDCCGRPNARNMGIFPAFARLSREFGMPRRIRTGNGTPFATNTMGRLSPLAI